MRQSVKDALADAETLRRHDSRSWRTGRNSNMIDKWARAARVYMKALGSLEEQTPEVLGGCAKAMAERAAHIAHRSVPGLRGPALVERDRQHVSLMRAVRKHQRERANEARFKRLMSEVL